MGPFCRQEHAPAQAPIGLCARPFDASQGVVGELGVIGQPARESLYRDDAPLDGPWGLAFGLHVRNDLVHAIGCDIAGLLESRCGADFANKKAGALDVAVAPLPSLHHRLEVGQVLVDELGRFDDDGFLSRVDDTFPTQGNIGQLVGQNALRCPFVRRLGAFLATLAVVIVPREVPRPAILPFVDAAFPIAAIAFPGHDAFPFEKGRPRPYGVLDAPGKRAGKVQLDTHTRRHQIAGNFMNLERRSGSRA